MPNRHLISVLPIVEAVLDLPQAPYTDLANGYKLVRRDQLENLDIFDDEPFKHEFGAKAVLQALNADNYLRVGIDVDVRSSATGIQAAIDQSNKKLDRLLVAFNVNEKLWGFTSDIRFSWFEDRSHCQVTSRQHWPYSTLDDQVVFRDFTDAAVLTATIDTIYLAASNNHYSALRTALDALQLGSYAFNASSRFLQEAIALEALCSASDTEVTHRLATTCAVLLGTQPEERNDIYKQAKRLYGIRSRIIHGSGARARIEELKEIQKLTRKVLRRILASDILPAYESRQKHRDFLLKLSLERVLTP